jgi:hypothetical protein
MNAVPDSLIFDPNAVPTSPGSALDIASENFIPVTFGGYSPDLPPDASHMWNPFPDGPPASWSRFAPYVGGNAFAGGLLGAINREAFFGIPHSSTSGRFTNFTGGLFGGGMYAVIEDAAEVVTTNDTSLTLGGPRAPTYAAFWGGGGSEEGWSVGPRPFAPLPPGHLTPPHPFHPFPPPGFYGPISFDLEFE